MISQNYGSHKRVVGVVIFCKICDTDQNVGVM
jgi:hypothetical protein